MDPGLRQLADRYLTANYARAPVTFMRGEGSSLFDDEGNEYLDFLTGISVCSLGHCHPDVVAVARKQIGTLDHVTNLFYTEPMARLAERLSEGSLGGRVFFCSSGAEANEAAIKLARKARPRGEIVVLERAFHGRTYGALSATPQPEKQEPFAPLVPGFITVPHDPAALADAVGEQTAAVMIEPVQGESGILPISDELLVTAREACDRHGALLVFDEIQSGMGRTGTLWAYEQTSVVPDLLTTAKALGAGLPIGALITTPKFGDVFTAGDHGTTFGGGPVVASVALKVLELIDNDELLAGVRERGELLASRLALLPHVREVVGRGLMLRAEIDGDAPQVVKRALLEQHLVINATGSSSLRFLPPLNVTESEIDEAARRLEQVL